MKNFRLFVTILFLLASLASILLFAIFDTTIFILAVSIIKNNSWPAGIAMFIFLAFLSAGVVSNLSRSEGSLISNGYFQLAILELFLFSAGLTWYWNYSQQPGQFILRLEPKTTRKSINLALKYESAGPASVDTVKAPDELRNMRAGKYTFETLDEDIVYFNTDIILEPGET